jgi:hypothetical protein
MSIAPPFPASRDRRSPRSLKRWWDRVSPGNAAARTAILDQWLAAALWSAGLSDHPWRWFHGQALPALPPAALAPDDVMILGELWQAAGQGSDKASGQWFTPHALIGRLLDQWANDWLTDQASGLSWDGQVLAGAVAVPQARALLAKWTGLAVIDPAMGAGEWLCGWFRLHQALGGALAGRAAATAPDAADSLQTLMGIDRDERAVSLAEIRLALLSGVTPAADRLVAADSLMSADDDWAPRSFDLVVGNPPYVSTRRLGATINRSALLARFGYADDLYAHFIDRGLQALRPGGWLLYIVSDTFRTTVTKTRLRRQLLAHRLHRLESLPADAFAATVATLALTVRHLAPAATIDLPPHGPVPLSDILLGPRQALIDPSGQSRERLAALRPHWEPLLARWADTLQNVRRQRDEAAAIADHRRSLKAGDWTLLGLICDGGVGLQTGDNSQVLAVRADSDAGARALTRQSELLRTWRNAPNLQSPLPAGASMAQGLTLLRDHGPPAGLGLRRGEVWRVIDPADVADPSTWPEDWRRHGAEHGPVWVPYEKGDPQGRRWVHENPFLIRWDREAVAALRRSARGRGQPVMRNPQFFFRPGVTWSNMSSHSLKARLQPPCVFDVGSMTLFPAVPWLDPLVLLAWLNAGPTTTLLKAYLNHTLNFQINDLRLLPVPVPTPQTAAVLRDLAAQAVALSPTGDTGHLEGALSAIVAGCYTVASGLPEACSENRLWLVDTWG